MYLITLDCVAGQDADLPDQIQDVNRSFMDDKRNILAVVSSVREPAWTFPTKCRPEGVSFYQNT